MKEQEIKNLMRDELKRYFHVMGEEEILEAIQNYKSVKDKNDRARKMRKRDPPPVDYNKEIVEKFGTRPKALKSITKIVQNEVRNRCREMH